MREEIENSLNDAFKDVNNSLNDFYPDNNKINDLTNNQNIKAEENVKYRKELFDKLDSLKELGFIIDYNDNMTNEELEDIINSINY